MPKVPESKAAEAPVASKHDGEEEAVRSILMEIRAEIDALHLENSKKTIAIHNLERAVKVSEEAEQLLSEKVEQLTAFKKTASSAFQWLIGENWSEMVTEP